MTGVAVGLTRLVEDPPPRLARARLGLLANQASIGPGYRHAVDLIDDALPGRLKVLLGPQHGFAGEKQDNMVESDHGRDAAGRPVYSLYGDARRPAAEMLADIDVLLIDLTDVGTRVYTFAQTTAYCLEEAARAGVDAVVLDRPNPIGGLGVEGNLLADDCASFVGLFPIPMRHGMTLGELSLYMADRLAAPRPEVITAAGWRRRMYFGETGLPWVLPSPNMPAPHTAWVYPGQVLWEGTNISEGRGTTRPFHLFGAPFIEPGRLRKALLDRGLTGAHFREAVFEPTFHKFAGQVCRGLEIHPHDPEDFKPYLTSLTALELLISWYGDEFSFKDPPYEYEYERLPIDLILGDKSLREGLLAGRSARELEAGWQGGLSTFLDERDRYLLYA
jgi:uncharacterized protein YbbC (DUF1343 family)